MRHDRRDRLLERPEAPRPGSRPARWALASMMGGAATILAAPAVAQDRGQPVRASVEVAVTVVRDGTGHVRVALCTPETFPGAGCPYHAAAPSRAGTTTVQVDGVPPGTYAVEAFHDDDDSGRMELSLLGIPKKGMGFSGGEPRLFGPPSFAAAAVLVGAGGARVVVRLRYY